jgi:hypothetical protein
MDTLVPKEIIMAKPLLVIPIRNDRGNEYAGSISIRGRDDIPTASASEVRTADPGLVAFTDEVTKAYERYLAGANIPPTTQGERERKYILTGRRRAVQERSRYERFPNFDPRVIKATELLFDKNPAGLTQAERDFVFSDWLWQMAQLYSVEVPVGTVFQNDTIAKINWIYNLDDMAALYDRDPSIFALDSSKPSIMSLFEEFRRTMQVQEMLATRLITCQFEADDFYNSRVGRCFQCGSVTPDGREGEVDAREKGELCSCGRGRIMWGADTLADFGPSTVITEKWLRYDRQAWAQSLYYQTRPDLFLEIVSQGKLEDIARGDLAPWDYRYLSDLEEDTRRAELTKGMSSYGHP